MGSQWAGMAKDLFKLKLFDETIREAAEILKAEGFDLYAVLKSDDESTFDNVLNSFVSITVMQVIGLHFVMRICGKIAFVFIRIFDLAV